MYDWLDSEDNAECIDCGSPDLEGCDRGPLLGIHVYSGDPENRTWGGAETVDYRCNDCGFRWVA